jgi:hypothetical protein
MREWSTDQKGAVAETEIAAAATRLQLPVLRPVAEGGRYDIVIDLGARLLRVQCKWRQSASAWRQPETIKPQTFVGLVTTSSRPHYAGIGA